MSMSCLLFLLVDAMSLSCVEVYLLLSANRNECTVWFQYTRSCEVSKHNIVLQNQDSRNGTSQKHVIVQPDGNVMQFNSDRTIVSEDVCASCSESQY
jgi:hypothetical protein